jgi:hypothetical protein
MCEGRGAEITITVRNQATFVAYLPYFEKKKK